jgi:chromosome segregation protein
MVFIKKMEARGFKSLGDKTVSIKFDSGFNAITGPNGSGKSNIVDSIIFCLGQNSPKKLRVDRLTSLIYDGGPNVRRPQAIRVSVTLDNVSRQIPIDSDTVTVTRELRQTGENRYILNGKRVTKSAMNEVLSLALISPEGLNFVPQGVITRLSELVPDEKRGLIEEIVGVAQFDEKKDRAMTQLRNADTKLQVAMARIGEMKNRVDSLERERNDQLRLRILEEDIRWLKAVIASSNIINTRVRIEEEKKHLEEYGSSMERLAKDLEELDHKIQALEEERKEFVTNVIDSSGGERVELEFAIGRVGSEIERLRREVTDANDLVRKIEDSLPHLQKMLENQSAESDKLRNRVSEQEAEVKELEESKGEAELSFRKLGDRQTRLQAIVGKKEEQVERLRQMIADYKDRADGNLRQIGNSGNKKSLLAERLLVLQEKSKTFLETLAHLEEQLMGLEELSRLEEDSLKKVGSSLTEVAERESRLQVGIGKALSTLNRVGDTVLKYDLQRSVVEKIAAEEVGLHRLESLSETGALDGYVGKLEDIVSFPPKYEAAVLSAGRRWMKAIIVRDLRSMLKTVEVAKRFKAGRVTVIPLSEVSNSSRIRPPTDARTLGTLAEVIRCKAAFKGLANFLFGDIVLVKTSREAYVASSKGFRSVTLAGDLFEPGSTAFETGYVAKMDDILEMVQDETSYNTVKGALKSLQGTISKRKKDIDDLQSEVRNLTSEKTRRSIVLERIKAETTTITDFIKKYRKIKKQIDLRVAKYAREVENTDKKIQRLESAKEKLNARIERCTAKIAEIAPHKVSEEIRSLEVERQDKRQLIEKKSIRLREVVTQLTRDRGNLDHNMNPSVSRLTEQIEQSEETLKEKRQLVGDGTSRLEGLTEEIKRLKGEESETLRKSRKSRPILESYDNRLNRLRRERDTMRRSIGNIEKEVVATNKGVESLGEAERSLLGEITLYGYSGPVETFEAAGAILRELSLEYEHLKNHVNLLAVASYQEVFSGYKNLSVRRNQLEEERNSIVKFIEDIESEKRRVFITGFEKIDRELREIFSKLTGGSAWLELEDPDDIFSKGVFLMAQFPDKLPRESSAVSGGEKTVSALSFILAIQSVYPSHFYLFDEIDAHLDARNSERLADLLRERSDNAQIVAVTLKDTVLSRASLVYGVYMESGTSQIVKYRPNLKAVARSER